VNSSDAQPIREASTFCNDGTFLWVEAAIDVLDKLAPGDAQRVSFASETTQSMWCRILMDIPNHLKGPACFLLKWLSTAFTPLKLAQLEDVWRFFTGT